MGKGEESVAAQADAERERDLLLQQLKEAGKRTEDLRRQLAGGPTFQAGTLGQTVAAKAQRQAQQWGKELEAMHRWKGRAVLTIHALQTELKAVYSKCERESATAQKAQQTITRLEEALGKRQIAHLDAHLARLGEDDLGVGGAAAAHSSQQGDQTAEIYHSEDEEETQQQVQGQVQGQGHPQSHSSLLPAQSEDDYDVAAVNRPRTARGCGLKSGSTGKLLKVPQFGRFSGADEESVGSEHDLIRNHHQLRPCTSAPRIGWGRRAAPVGSGGY